MDRPLNLPQFQDDFVGRAEELERLLELLHNGTRLITLTGPGGVGKTRLALEATVYAAASFADRVHFVSLDPLSQADEVLPAVANALGAREEQSGSRVAAIARVLADEPALLCLDNWEHVLDAASALTELLVACPGVYVLATSREALRLPGEHVFPVRPLRLSAAGDPRTGEEPDAVRLFVTRACAVRSRFALSEVNRHVVAEICALLDGLPLAIELAAALTRFFSPQALLAHLQGSSELAGRAPAMRVIAGGPRDVPVRQQTLHGTIDWSYRLLDPAEQRLFRRLGVFAGGCDLGGLEAIYAHGDSARPPLDIALALVDKSLLRAAEAGGEPRFDFLRTVHDYAREQLVASGELTETQRLHALYYLDLARRADKALHTPEHAGWMDRLEREQENLRAALTWSLASAERASVALDLANSLWPFWWRRGHYAEGAGWLERVRALDGEVSDSARAWLTLGWGQMLGYLGDNQRADALFAEGLELAKRANDLSKIEGALNSLAVSALHQGRYEDAVGYFREGLRLARECEDRWRVAKQLNGLGSALLELGEFNAAREHVAEGLVTMRECGDAVHIAEGVAALGEIALRRGDYEEARRYCLEARKLSEELSDSWQIHMMDYALGLAALEERRFAEAEARLRASLAGRQAIGDGTNCPASLEALACLASALSDPERAARLWGAAGALRKANGMSLGERSRKGYDPYIKAARIRLRERQFVAAEAAGGALTLEQAIQYALEPAAMSQAPEQKGRRPRYPAGLTVREVEVLALVAQGLSDGEVAERLVLSPRTVNAHLTSIYNKLGVNSRMAAARLAVEQKLV